jgi:hypothetical protein
VTYALSRLVSIWMGLYYNLQRARRWMRELDRTPTVEQTVEYLAGQKYPYRDQPLFWSMRDLFYGIRDAGCQKTLQVLEHAWSSALKAEDSVCTSRTEVVSLIDLPRYYGASWPHNDIVVYLPNLGKAAVMRLSDARFEPLRKRLASLTGGTDPFIGTTFSISHSKLNPIFNRIRCSKASPVDSKSLKSLDSFNTQLTLLSPSYVDGSYLISLFDGKLGLEIGKCVTARYGNNYALMQFVVADAQLLSAYKHPAWDYTFRFSVDRMELSGSMFRNSLFDPVAKPETHTGTVVRFAAFAVVGTSALQQYKTHLHIISIAPSADLANLSRAPGFSNEGPDILDVETELTEATEAIKEPTLADEIQLERELIARETPKPIPKIPAVKELDLLPAQGRTLVLLSSDRLRGFPFEEIRRRLRHEGVEVTPVQLQEVLQQLASKELVFQSVFGEEWSLNPAVRIIPSRVAVPVEAIEARISEYLEMVYPVKVRLRTLIGKICGEDSRATPRAVTRATHNLVSSQRVLMDKLNRCSANPYAPRPETEGRVVERFTETHARLTEDQVLRLPEVSFAHRSGIVLVYSGANVAKKQWVKDYHSSAPTVKQIISEIQRGVYTALQYEDHLQGTVRVWMEKGTLKGSYTNQNPRNVQAILAKLGARSGGTDA